MIKVKINDAKHDIPTKWEEVTFSMFVSLLDAKDDYLQVLSIIIGIPKDELKGAKIQGLDAILPKLAFLKKEPVIDSTPTKLGEYVFPHDVTFETIEQFEETRAEINRVGQSGDLKIQTEALALYAAIYCTKPYDSEQAKYLAKSFMSYPCLEVMSAGSFFQAKCLSMQSGLSMNFLRKNILLRKRRPGLDRLMRRLGFMLHLTPSRGM